MMPGMLRRACASLLALGISTLAFSAGAAAPVVIEYYGDSTVWGYRSGSGDQVATPAPLAFAQALGDGKRHTVRNEGVNGSTACGLLNGTDGRHPPWASLMASSPARFVILNHAINDQWKYPLAQYTACLRGLVQGARTSGKRIIFETPNPTRDSAPDGLDLYAQAMRDVASEMAVPVIDQYAYLKQYLAGRPVQEICPDGLHPSENVYVLKGRYAARMFKSWFPVN